MHRARIITTGLISPAGVAFAGAGCGVAGDEAPVTTTVSAALITSAHRVSPDGNCTTRRRAGRWPT